MRNISAAKHFVLPFAAEHSDIPEKLVKGSLSVTAQVILNPSQNRKISNPEGYTPKP